MRGGRGGRVVVCEVGGRGEERGRDEVRAVAEVEELPGGGRPPVVRVLVGGGGGRGVRVRVWVRGEEGPDCGGGEWRLRAAEVQGEVDVVLEDECCF